jgi:serine/threonine protein kinase
MAEETEASYLLNRELLARSELFDLVQSPDFSSFLKDFQYDWNANRGNENSVIYRVFDKQGWAEDQGALSRSGRLIYGRLALHFDEITDGNIVGNYIIEGRLKSGKNSVVFAALHKVLGSKVVLKFIRPEAADNIASSLRLLASGQFDGTILMPTDIIAVDTKDIVGAPTKVDCLVFPFVEGRSFRDFINTRNNHLNSHVVISFIRQVGGALAKLEAMGAYHGDLHSQNIVVSSRPEDPLTFKLLDISFGAVGSTSLEASRNSDLELFKQHVWSILIAQKQCIPNVSLRRFVGTRFFRKITTILSSRVNSFADLMGVFNDELDYERFLDEKQRFIAEHFAPPASFRLQRYEEFIDPSVASQLFVPFEELQEKINEFSNVYVSGNRGSGKSTYLASLAFFPTVANPLQDFRSTFGIYFPCRQGEFRAIAVEKRDPSRVVDRTILHLLVIKVVRRTLEIISDAIARKLIKALPDYGALKDYLNRFIPAPGIISVESEILSEIENFSSTLLRVELDELREFNIGKAVTSTAATPSDLLTFFTLLKSNFPELAQTRFHILFDDAGEPYVDAEVQRAMNELIINSNPNYCVKLTAEKNTYVFEGSRGKLLENGHDYYEQDISYTLFLGPRTVGIRHEKLEKYFSDIVGLRLKYFDYQSHDIRDYLGTQSPESVDRLTLLLALGRRDANYFGWTTVWHIADRTPRNLLELVSEIFAAGKIDHNTKPRLVEIRDQNRAIKSISEKRLQSLSQISGSLVINGKTVSLGRKLFDVTVAIGSAFHMYLKQDARRLEKRPRIRQHLAIERNELTQLRDEAETILQKLVTFGILDSSKIVYSRDDEIKKPIYVLNRIFCPAFGIGYRRDDHLRLSKMRLEQLLISPHEFMREGTKRLRQESERGGGQTEFAHAVVCGRGGGGAFASSSIKRAKRPDILVPAGFLKT